MHDIKNHEPPHNEYLKMDRSTDVERFTEKRVSHLIGERSMGSVLITVPLEMTYVCNLASDEVEPVMGVHTSLRKPPKVGYTRFPIVWSSAYKSGEQSVAHKLRVNIAVPFPWPRDASIWFQLFARVKSTEGVYRLEKAGSACFPLHLLVGSHEETTGSSKPIGSFSIPLVLQSARIMQEKPFFKGAVRIDYKYGKAQIRDHVHGRLRALYLESTELFFQKESEWDISDKNVKYIESLMMQAVATTIAPFSRQKVEFSSGLNKAFEATDQRIVKIHTPLYITMAGAIPGARYWGNLAMEKHYDSFVYTQIMEIALERARMSKEHFIMIAERITIVETLRTETLHTSSKRPHYDARFTAVTSVFASACTIVATSIPYIGDYVELNKGRMDKHGNFAKKKTHVTTESFDDAIARGADDCEGEARVIARVFVGFRDGDFPKDNALLMAAQKIASVYTIVGVLGSVAQHARNINEAKGAKGNDQPLIGSPEDSAGGVGAHMWTMLFPTRHLLRLASKTSKSRLPRWTDGRTYKDFPEWHERLPIFTGEGTGMLNPAALPASAYYESVARKTVAINGVIRRKDVLMRVMTDVSLADTIRGSTVTHDYHKDPRLEFDTPGELSKLQMIREQPVIIEDRNRRVSNFYMRATAMFALVRPEDEIQFDVRKSEGELPKSWGDQAHDFYRDKVHADARVPYRPRRDVPYPVYTWRLLIPVEGGDRPKDWNGTFGPSQVGAETFDSEHLKWGVNVGDIMYKREHVAILRGPSTTTQQEKTIGSVLRHLPPLAEMRPLTEEEGERASKITRTMNKVLQNTMIHFDRTHPRKRLGSLLDQNNPAFEHISHTSVSGRSGSTEIQMLFLKSQDATVAQIRRISERVAKCPYVLGARFVSEQVIPDLGNYRLELVVNADDVAELNATPSSGFRWVTEHSM